MADPQSYRPRTSEIPTLAGVYRFFDENDTVIYVGKAKNLRNRLTSYFQDLSRLTPKTRAMVTTAVGVKWTVVQSELEALTLEYAWIKEFQPKYNVLYRDDKSYPYLAVSMGSLYPRVMITRSAHHKGTKYFGPYSKVWAIRETLDNLIKVFQVRSCSDGVFARAKSQNRPCLLADIKQCSAPCVGRISVQEHRQAAWQLCSFMSGNTGSYIRDKKAQMNEAAQKLEFEKAGRIRDEIIALEKVLEKNAVVFSDETDADVFAIEADELQAAIVLFHVRAGRIRATKSWNVERVDDSTPEQLLTSFLMKTYSDFNENEVSRLDSSSIDDIAHYDCNMIPREILLSRLPDEVQVLQEYISELRKAKVQLRVPQRGDKATLMDTALKNAKHTLQLEKMRRLNDITVRSQTLELLRQELQLPKAPLRIECYDTSHIQGTNHVASMVVFEDGIPKKKEYRSFNVVATPDGSTVDDTAAMAQILTRRLKRLLQQEQEPVAEVDDFGNKTIKRFSYRPDLLVVDGGLPQVNTAQRVVDELGLEIPVVGLAKRLEEIWISGQDYPIILPRRSQALYLLQHLRDESHRFAITLHRKKRSKAMTKSVLDTIDGLGDKRKQLLVKHFGSVAKIKQASVEQLMQVEGFGENLAVKIYNQLHEQT